MVRTTSPIRRHFAESSALSLFAPSDMLRSFALQKSFSVCSSLEKRTFFFGATLEKESRRPSAWILLSSSSPNRASLHALSVTSAHSRSHSPPIIVAIPPALRAFIRAHTLVRPSVSRCTTAACACCLSLRTASVACWCIGDGLVFKMDFGRLGVGASVGVPGISSNVRFRKSADWKGSRNRSDGPECKGVVSGGEALLKLPIGGVGGTSTCGFL
mmetsp:Transcript_12660/g.21446  ORF Transcript_12660/g.21446 Transcript_12660/m.21446 type:complete len:215 (-) Transcript_12660:90-734(-)